MNSNDLKACGKKCWYFCCIVKSILFKILHRHPDIYRNLDFIYFLEILHTILQVCLHQRFYATINRFSLPSEYKQPMKSSICHTFIGFQKCTKIPINTDILRVHRSVLPSLYPFYSQNCLHILSKTFWSTAKHPTKEMGSIRCGS